MTGRQHPILIDIPDQLETERLLLRPPGAGDGPVMNAAIQESGEALGRWFDWAKGGQTVAESEVFVRESAANFIRRESFHYMIWHKIDSQFVGMCSLFNLDWGVPACEIGYWLRTSLQGKGYMTEAVHCLTHLAFDTLDAQRVQIRCGGHNRRSAAVAERAGFTLEGRLRHYFRTPKNDELDDMLIYAKIVGE